MYSFHRQNQSFPNKQTNMSDTEEEEPAAAAEETEVAEMSVLDALREVCS